MIKKNYFYRTRSVHGKLPFRLTIKWLSNSNRLKSKITTIACTTIWRFETDMNRLVP